MRLGRRKLLLLASFLSLGIVAIVAQTPNPRISTDPAARFRNAANRWRIDPVDIKTQKDTTSQNDRRVRDEYWDRCCGQPAPLSQPAKLFVANVDEELTIPNAPEFPVIKDGVWLIGRFEAYHTYLSTSERSIYTEINVRVQHVFGRPTIELPEGSLIDVGFYGGTITAPWGGAYTYQVQPKSDSFEPGHTYLLLLQCIPNGNFYLRGKRWDLTTGKVQPQGGEVVRAREGKSEIVGQDIPAMTKLLDKRFSLQGSPR